SLRKRFRNLSFARPNAAISEQCRVPHSTARNAINRISIRSWRGFFALGSGTLSNAVRERGIGDPLESVGVVLRIHNLPLCKPPQLSSNAIPLRAPPELVFDQRLGSIFAARIAGNFVNTDIIGSLEFACKLAGAKAIVVLGHSDCGAIKGAIDQAKIGNVTAMLWHFA